MVTIDEQGWLHAPWIVHIPGHPEKKYSQPNSGTGIACHSVVGYESEFSDGIPNRFLQDTRPNKRGRFNSYEAASCVFVLRKYATFVPGYTDLIQMYPITTSTWTSGGREANTRFIPFELEGGEIGNEEEPISDIQMRSFIDAVRAIEKHKGIKYVPGENMLEHRHIAAKYKYAPTACASGRYERAWDALLSTEEPGRAEGVSADHELRKEVQQLKAQYDRLNEVLVKREQLRGIAAHADASRVEKAHELLRKGGIIF